MHPVLLQTLLCQPFVIRIVSSVTCKCCCWLRRPHLITYKDVYFGQQDTGHVSNMSRIDLAGTLPARADGGRQGLLV